MFKLHSTLLLLSTFLSLAACQPDSSTTPSITAKAGQESTQVTVTSTAVTTIIDIYSAKGIGEAQILSDNGQWPAQITLRLHLQGLEGARIRYGATAVAVSVSSTGAQTITQTVRYTNNTEEAITPDNPFWVPTAIITEEGTDTTIPLKNGFFELRPPPDFFKAQHDQFSISWIDFYR